MKILHIESGKHLYGGAKQVQLIINGLQQRGVENHLICTKGAEIAKAVQDSGATIHPIHFPHEVSIPVIFRIKKIIQRIKPDIVHLHSRRGADTLGGIAAKLSGTPCVLSRRVDNTETALIFKPKYALYDKVISISQGIGDVLVSQGLSKDKLRVVHSSIHTSDYLKAYDKTAFKQEFSLSDKAIIIGVVAQLIKRKGHRYLFECLPSLIKKHPNLHVLCFGQGPLLEELQQSINQLKLSKHVTLTGFRNDLDKWFGCLDLLVHPADMEGLGVSLLQTGATGVPIIASNVGGIPEIVIHEKTGLLIEPGDVEHLEHYINTLVSSAELRQRYGHALQQHIQKTFSIETMITGNLAVYNEILNR